jgi:ribosomal protein S18 acetylase RimI-like enzyme
LIRPTMAADRSALLAMIQASGEFDAAGLAHVAETLDAYLQGDKAALWLTAEEDEPLGVAYCAPEPVTDGTWNLLMLWTRQDRGGQGLGSALVGQLETLLQEKAARMLIVETSDLPAFAAARAFYRRAGFTEVARIQDFYAAGDAKLVFTKALAPPSTRETAHGKA